MLEALKKLDELIRPILAEEGCELVDIELTTDAGQRVLRIYIDKEGGVIVADCQRVSHAIEDILEVEQLITGRYNLEVSSPGLNRPLKTQKHFSHVLGKEVNVQTLDKINGRGRFKGILKEVRGEGNEVQLVIFIDNQDFLVPLSLVSKANLVFEL